MKMCPSPATDRQPHPVYAEQRAGLAEDADDLLDLAVAHPLTDAAEHHQSSGLERRVVLERKPGISKTHTYTFPPRTFLFLNVDTLE